MVGELQRFSFWIHQAFRPDRHCVLIRRDAAGLPFGRTVLSGPFNLV